MVTMTIDDGTQHLFKWLLGLALLCMGDAAMSASMGKTGLDALLQQADTVVVARCDQVEGYWQGKKVRTRNVLTIEQSIKGDAAPSITLDMPGGTAIHPRLGFPVSTSVSTGVSFDVGESAVLLLKQDPRAGYLIVGMAHGRFPITVDADTGIRRIRVGPHKLGVRRDTDGEGGVQLGAEQMRLDEFIAFLQQRIDAMNRTGGQP